MAIGSKATKNARKKSFFPSTDLRSPEIWQDALQKTEMKPLRDYLSNPNSRQRMVHEKAVKAKWRKDEKDFFPPSYRQAKKSLVPRTFVDFVERKDTTI